MTAPLDNIEKLIGRLPAPSIAHRRDRITPQKLEIVLAAIGKGHAVADAARIGQVSLTSIYMTRKTDRTFATRFELARAAGAKARADMFLAESA